MNRRTSTTTTVREALRRNLLVSIDVDDEGAHQHTRVHKHIQVLLIVPHFMAAESFSMRNFSILADLNALSFHFQATDKARKLEASCL